MGGGEPKHRLFRRRGRVHRVRAFPDFRGVDGLYRQKYAYPPETILSHEFLLQHPEEFSGFYREKILDY